MKTIYAIVKYINYIAIYLFIIYFNTNIYRMLIINYFKKIFIQQKYQKNPKVGVLIGVRRYEDST